MGKLIKTNFKFKRRFKNESYEKSLVKLEKSEKLCSCLLRHKSDKNVSEKDDNFLSIKTQPKWVAELFYEVVDNETGEIFDAGIDFSDDFSKIRKRKYDRLKVFFDYYQPLYEKRVVTLFFFTFTQANLADVPFSTAMDNVRKRFKRMDLPIRGYFWITEFSENHHFHYHLCIATNRVQLKTIPDSLKMNTFWGRRTQVDFVKGISLKCYINKKLGTNTSSKLTLMNYFQKTNTGYPVGFRNFGQSKFFL